MNCELWKYEQTGHKIYTLDNIWFMTTWSDMSTRNIKDIFPNIGCILVGTPKMGQFGNYDKSKSWKREYYARRNLIFTNYQSVAITSNYHTLSTAILLVARIRSSFSERVLWSLCISTFNLSIVHASCMCPELRLWTEKGLPVVETGSNRVYDSLYLAENAAVKL